MNIMTLLFGWDWKVRKMRKKWDRLREKTLKEKDPLRERLLKKLDNIENNLRILEEQKLGRVDRARITKTVEIELEEAAAMLEEGKAEEGVYR